MRQQAILTTLCIHISSSFLLCPATLYSQDGCCSTLSGHNQLCHQQQSLCSCSRLADLSSHSCLAASRPGNARQTQLAWPRMELLQSVCSRGTALHLLCIYLYQWGKPHLLEQSKADSNRNHNQYKNRFFYFSAEKKMQLSATGSIQFSPKMCKQTLTPFFEY